MEARARAKSAVIGSMEPSPVLASDPLPPSLTASTSVATTLNPISAVLVPETIRQHVLSKRQRFQIFRLQGNDGAPLLYHVVGSNQLFAINAHLLEVCEGGVRNEGKILAAPLMPGRISFGDNLGDGIRIDLTANNTSAIFIAAAGDFTK